MATKGLNGSPKTTPTDVTDQIEILRSDISALTQTIADLGKTKGLEVKNAAKATAADLRDQAAIHAEHAKDQATELQGQANEFIRTQPATAMGIAAGVGFLVGYLGRRG